MEPYPEGFAEPQYGSPASHVPLGWPRSAVQQILHERRRTVQAYLWWNDERVGVTETPVSLVSLPHDIRPHSVIRRVTGAPGTGSLRYLGAHFSECLSRPGGRDNPCAYAAAAFLGMFSALTDGLGPESRPVFNEGRFLDQNHKRTIRYRAVVLPLGTAGRLARYFLCVGGWR